MGQRELEAALRRDGESKAAEIWRSVEAEAEQLRSEAAQSLERQRHAAHERRQRKIAALQDAALAAARKQAQHSRLAVEGALALRLRQQAEGLLEGLAAAGGAQLFQRLAAELPAFPWQQVRIHPRDEACAREVFPEAEVLPGKKISAGLEVLGDDGRIQIINTLEKRLEHLWPELLPELFKELRQMAGDDEAVA